jgi:hypothetical protein
LASGHWIRGVSAACHCPGRVHSLLCVLKRGSDSKIRTTGIKSKLKESGSYPVALGQRIVECAWLGQPMPQGWASGVAGEGQSAVSSRKSMTKTQQHKSSVLRPARGIPKMKLDENM